MRGAKRGGQSGLGTRATRHEGYLPHPGLGATPPAVLTFSSGSRSLNHNDSARAIR